MTREEAIHVLKMVEAHGSLVIKAKEMAIESLEMKKTNKFDRMIEAFECDFSLIQEGERTFADLDRLMNDSRYSLAEHMDLMQELSYLIRHGKAEIYVRSEEND